MAILVQLLSVVFAVQLFFPGKGETVASWATLHPDTDPTGAGAANAIDGQTNIGESGADNVSKCASTKAFWKQRPLQYLQINLQRPYSIAAIRLHLRDGLSKQKWQNDLIVRVSNSTIDKSSIVGTQCGDAYDAGRLEQSPLFRCSTPGGYVYGQYVYAILKNKAFPLQVCEMQVFKVMDLTEPGVATFIPANGDVYKFKGKKALARNAVDGRSSIGESGINGGQNCAGLQKPSRLQCFRVDLGHAQHIYSIRLRLRDGIYAEQEGMIVKTSNNSDFSTSWHSCGEPYDPKTNNSQSPVFVCDSTARYVWMVLRSSKRPLFICEVEVYADIRCSKPPDSKYSATRLTHGGCLSCEEGFRLKSRSPDPVICEMSGNWSRSLPTCQKTTCNSLPNITNGTLQFSGVTVGSSATYTCLQGFKIQQNEGGIRDITLNCIQRKRTEPAEWDKPIPICILDENYCVSEAPLNGRACYTADGESNLRINVTFVCNPGFLLVGVEFLECQNGEYHGEIPNCIVVDCHAPVVPKHGFVYVKTTTFRSWARYSCNPGYKTRGTRDIRCLSTGNWSSTPPLCIPVCKRPPDVIHGQVTIEGDGLYMFPVGTTAKYSCHRGYTLVGDSVLKCIGSYKWSGEAPTCQLEAVCKKPPDLINGQVTIEGKGSPMFPMGTSAIYSCYNCYILVGASVRTCIGPYKWSGESPTCQVVDCGNPPKVENGFFEGKDFSCGAKVIYRCKSGYLLKGWTTSTCQPDGKWTDPPTCERILIFCDCGNPTHPVNGYYRLIDGATTFGCRVKYFCNEQHNLKGNTSAQCNEDKEWRPPAPLCIPFCKRPPEVPNARIKGQKNCRRQQFDVNTTVRYRCHPDYELSDNSSRERTCLPDSLIWSGSPPSCKLIDCGKPVVPTDGFCWLQNASTTIGSTAECCCAAGFDLQGNRSFRCEAKGWNATPPFCVPFCDRPPDIANGKLVNFGDDVRFDVGTSVLYTCNERYAFSREENGRRTCLPDRTWSGIPAPICHELNRSNCHKDVVYDDGYCRCKEGFIGNGIYCCPKDMGSETAIVGATVLFRCDRGCNISFLNVKWCMNGSPLDYSQTRYGLASNGMLLYVENVTSDYSGKYTCIVTVGRNVYERYGNLKVTDCPPELNEPCGKSCASTPAFLLKDTETYAGQFPWQAMLCSPPRGQYCGGALVSSDCIATAAHCLSRGSTHIQNMKVCLGRQCGNCSEKDPEREPKCFERKSFDIHIHPKFVIDRGTFKNNIAVIKLKTPATLNCKSIYPVCLPNSGKDEDTTSYNGQGIVTGWGTANSPFSISKCLLQSRVSLMASSTCREKHGNYPISNSMMCAKLDGVSGGDSGGPLVVNARHDTNRYVLAGLESWRGCGEGNPVAVYTKVLSHLDWIKNSCGIQD